MIYILATYTVLIWIAIGFSWRTIHHLKKSNQTLKELVDQLDALREARDKAMEAADTHNQRVFTAMRDELEQLKHPNL